VVLFVLLTARMTGLAGQAARQQERERAIAKVLEAAQQERIRLAADLHDGPVQELTALSYGLERVDRRLQAQGPDAALGLLGEQKNHLVKVTRTLRNLLSELRPPAIDEHGLAGALKLHAAAFAKQAKTSVDIDAEVGHRPAPEGRDDRLPDHPGGAEQRRQARPGRACLDPPDRRRRGR
jgi:signal transduction histidine kinase